MIYGNLSDEKTYAFLPDAVRKCLQFARTHELSKLDTGRHTIDGDDIYVNIAEYTTDERSKKGWEAHKQYIDIHVLSQGEEYIDVSFVQHMTAGTYEEQTDYVPISGTEIQSSCHMRPGDFLICYAEDAHRPGVQVQGPALVKKGIFKVRIQEG